MRRSRYYRYKPVKDVQSVEAVSTSLNEGINSIINICKSLKEAHISPITDTCSNYNQIRKHITHAEQCLNTSEKMIQGKLRDLDESMCQLIREKQNVEQQKKEKNLALDNLYIKKSSAVELLRNSKEALEQAERRVESANHAIRVHQDRMNTSDDLATTGAILCAIPVLGWIAGPIMISEGQQGFEEALNSLRAAEWEKQNFESQVRNCNAKVSHYDGIISRTRNEIEQTNEALTGIEWKVEEVQKNLNDTENARDMVRGAVHLLGVLSGNVAVLEKQTQRFVNWQPVVEVMQDVIKAVLNIAENRLLYRDVALSLIDTLRENFTGLLSLRYSSSYSEYDRYC